MPGPDAQIKNLPGEEAEKRMEMEMEVEVEVEVEVGEMEGMEGMEEMEEEAAVVGEGENEVQNEEENEG
tara:strand:+ start:364 stop:570 length:207 start_codon:yes stop_codon:yes gene_type:complete